MIIKRFLVLGCMLPFCMTACKTTEESVKTEEEPVPEWVLTPPKSKGKVCAVGASEPTYYREDGKEAAAESARRQLARSLSVEIKSIMLDVATARNHNTDEEGTMEISAWATDSVVNNSEIVAYWYDENGIASFKRKGITYALACVPIKK